MIRIIYNEGKVASHEGGWLSGVSGATFGMMMPGQPVKGDKFYQEHAPKIAMDRCEIVATDESCTTPAGEFGKCFDWQLTRPPMRVSPPGPK